ncbi:dihydrodipicolinate synthase family protein [Chelativorans sp. SCAU2101]|jgi:Dihydrodipicolinate synthase/N-acetylneuraminate lyase|uniref:Dihydrodipicolinate synthase family protein n=1 Tax=Chelativorans petroleitrophicus TaxID=2975484 RepID=A0A9X3B9F0_9HYPH|nr:dihydrodipicolinate synthase family protein [Chelativorans petroleitrophicus]MCT8990396.1 dihydrodipicolinate synthase family protein [Chelativorans petroleitrophicus]
MRQQRLELADFRKSVVAVPPVAWTESLELNPAANAALVRHIEAGGISILLYGGNANLYHIDLGRFRALLDLLRETAGPSTAVIPSIGPDFGKMLDQAPIVRDKGFSDVMVLPTAFPARAAGIERGVGLVAEALGFGVILYIKQNNYIEPDQLERMVKAGSVRFVKYAVERANPEGDTYLSDIVAAIGAERVASGMGERPIHSHLMTYGLATYTSGAVCIAPAAALATLHAYRAGDLETAERLRAPFLEFERQRAEIDGFGVMHDAVTLSGIADMGPILPLLANIAKDKHETVAKCVKDLLDLEQACRAEGGQNSKV